MWEQTLKQLENLDPPIDQIKQLKMAIQMKEIEIASNQRQATI